MVLYKWYQTNNTVVISFNIPTNITKNEVQADIANNSIALGVRGYALNCEGNLYSTIKGSKWAVKDNNVQIHLDKNSPGKWPQLLSVVAETYTKAVVLFDYEPTTDEELALFSHEVINVTSRDESGWWEGTKGSESGVFPSNFVAEFQADYQEAEDIDASNEASKAEEAAPINQVSRMGINMMGNMDELKNKLAIRKTATYNAADIENAISHGGGSGNDDNQNNAGFMAVKPTGANRMAVKSVMMKGSPVPTKDASTGPSPIQPIQPIQLKPTTTTTNNTQPPAVQPIGGGNKESQHQPTSTHMKEVVHLAVKKDKEEKEKERKEEKEKEKKEEKEKDSTGSKESKVASIFKKPFQKILTTGGSSPSTTNSSEEKNNSGTKTKAKVIYDFETKEAGELNLRKGDIVVVQTKDSSGWWQGINQSSGASGWFSCTFVEEIKEVAPPTSAVTEKSPKVKSPPSKPTGQPQSVEMKLQSLDETPKLEHVKKPSAAKGRKPPSRVRASYLLSPEEQKEREKLKSSFYSHVVASNRDIPDEDEEPQQLSRSNPSSPLSSSGGAFSPPPPLGSVEQQKTKPPPPKRSPMASSSGAVPSSSTTPSPTYTSPISQSASNIPVMPETSSITSPSSPPITRERPAPPKASLKPTNLSSSDGYEQSTIDTEQPKPLFGVLKKAAPKPPATAAPVPPPTSNEEETTTKPLKPTTKPRVPIPTQQDIPAATEDKPIGPGVLKKTKPPVAVPTQESDVTNESTGPIGPGVLKKTKPPAVPPPTQESEVTESSGPIGPGVLKKAKPPVAAPTQESDVTNESTGPIGPGVLKKTKPPAVPPSSGSSTNVSQELADKLSRFSDDSTPSTDKPTPAGPPKSPPMPRSSDQSSINKPPPRLVKKAAPAGAPPPPSASADSQESSPSSVSPPQPPIAKPKVAPRAATGTSPPSTSPPPPSTISHKRAPSNPMTSPPQKKLSLDDFNQLCADIANICTLIENESSPATPNPFKHIYPPLPETFFSVAVCSIDGQFWGNDDMVNDQQIPMFQAIYPFLYCILCEEIGVDQVSKFIDNQPVPQGEEKPINAATKKVYNPFTLAGQIVTSHLFCTKYPNAMIRISQFLNIIQSLVSANTVSCDMVSYLSQKSDTSDEIITAHLLKSSSLIKQPEDILDFFYQLSSIQLNSKQISVLAATLASEGICPFSPQLSLAPKSIVIQTNEILKSCSTISNNNNSNNNNIIPIISDSGVLMLIIPGVMGISVVSSCNSSSSSSLSSPPTFSLRLSDHHKEFYSKLSKLIN